MILNYQRAGRLEEEFSSGKVLLDGEEVDDCIYIDNNQGVLVTLDLLGHPDLLVDGFVPKIGEQELKFPRLAKNSTHLFRDGKIPADVSAPDYDVLTWTRYGQIELIFPDGRRV